MFARVDGIPIGVAGREADRTGSTASVRPAGRGRQCAGQCVGRCLRSELFDRSIFDKNRIITPMALHDLCGRRAVGSTSGHTHGHARYSRRVPIPQTERDCLWRWPAARQLWASASSRGVSGLYASLEVPRGEFVASEVHRCKQWRRAALTATTTKKPQRSNPIRGQVATCISFSEMNATQHTIQRIGSARSS